MSDTPFSEWVGRSQTIEDIARQQPLDGLAALLDHAQPLWHTGEAPPLGHWLYFLPHARQSEIDVDGHPRRGGFLPPIALPRRMWAGSRIRFEGPIMVGAKIVRRSMITRVSEKAGASGRMVFVTVSHEITADGRAAVFEEQDIVFREAPKAPAAATEADSPARVAEHAREHVADITQLFRFSALTFNAHRIHYDRDYAREVEGYPGLVVQGPYTATLLMDHFLRHHPGARVAGFAFRARRPLFEGGLATLCLAERNGSVELWARDPAGREAMTAELTTGENA